jgi:hypothetical protein
MFVSFGKMVILWLKEVFRDSKIHRFLRRADKLFKYLMEIDLSHGGKLYRQFSQNTFSMFVSFGKMVIFMTLKYFQSFFKSPWLKESSDSKASQKLSQKTDGNCLNTSWVDLSVVANCHRQFSF